MEQYTLVLQRRGDKWNPADHDSSGVHAAFLKDLTTRGDVALSGMFLSHEHNDLLGVAIFRDSADQAAKLIQDDPAIHSGRLGSESHSWATAKGVLAPGQPLQ